MFPKLSDLIYYLTGSQLDLPVQTYGFFLAMAFLLSGFTLRAELKRKEKEGLLVSRIRKTYPGKPFGWLEIIPGIILSAVIGWKLFGILFQYRHFAENPRRYIFSQDGSITALITIAVISFAYHLYKRVTAKNDAGQVLEEIIQPHQNTWNIMIVGIVSAIIGSKLFDIFDNIGIFLENPLYSLTSFNGLTFYGGFILTVIALMFYMKVVKLDWRHVIDSTAPGIMIGYALGRLGCHFSGDGCWGVVNTLTQPHWLAWMPDWLWASDFPHNVANRGIPISGCMGSNCRVLENPVFPTSLYESGISFISFGILWIMRLRVKAPVIMFGLFMIFNGFERFFIEKIRVNNKHSILGLHVTQAEMISALLILSGIAVIVYFTRIHKKAIKIADEHTRIDDNPEGGE